MENSTEELNKNLFKELGTNITRNSIEIAILNENLIKWLDLGANINYRDIYGNTILHKVIRDNLLSTVKFLLERGADPNIGNRYGHTPLMFILVALFIRKDDSIDITKELIYYGANLNIENYRGDTFYKLLLNNNNKNKENVKEIIDFIDCLNTYSVKPAKR
jgi:ankyrin repeat protein